MRYSLSHQVDRANSVASRPSRGRCSRVSCFRCVDPQQPHAEATPVSSTMSTVSPSTTRSTSAVVATGSASAAGVDKDSTADAATSAAHTAKTRVTVRNRVDSSSRGPVIRTEIGAGGYAQPMPSRSRSRCRRGMRDRRTGRTSRRFRAACASSMASSSHAFDINSGSLRSCGFDGLP
jgi:hypothetical protein